MGEKVSNGKHKVAEGFVHANIVRKEVRKQILFLAVVVSFLGPSEFLSAIVPHEYRAIAQLWYAILRHVYDFIVQSISDSVEIFDYLLKYHPIADVGNTLYVFHYHPKWLKVRYRTYEFLVEMIARVINKAETPRKRESLTRRTANDHIDRWEPIFGSPIFNVS